MDRNQLKTLELFGYAFEELPNLKTMPMMDYIFPDGTIHTGRADAYHMKRYLSRGLKLVLNKQQNSKPQLVCEVCGKEFKLPIALAGHKRTHKKS